MLCFFKAKAQIYYGIHQTDFSKEVVYPFNQAKLIQLNNQKVNPIYNGVPYSITYHAWKPAELVNKVFKLKVSFKAKSTAQKSNCKLIISADVNDSSVYYQDRSFEVTGSWNSFSDTALFPFNMDNAAKFKTYVNSDLSTDTILISELKIEYLEVMQDDYLFQPLDNSKIKYSNPRILYSNKYYQLNFLPVSNQLFFSDSYNNQLTHAIYTTIEEGNEAKHGTSHSPYFILKSENKKKDTTFFVFENLNSDLQSEVKIACVNNSPQLFFNIKSIATKGIEMYRLTLTIPFLEKVNTIYAVNDKRIGNNELQNQYWLGKKGGVAIGDNSKSIITLFNSHISSLQVDTRKQLMVFNVDFSKDHPMLNMPLLAKEENKKRDVSTVHLLKNDFVEGGFSVVIGQAYTDIPLINTHYSDYSSTFIFTEHADWAITETHRAVYFGNSKITLANEATGGFVKYNIPVTKSVFYHNPFRSQLKEITENKLLQKPFASIKENKDFEFLVKQLYKLNYEICLHSPEDKTTQKKWAEDAMDYFNKEFGSVSWIDHGYDNAKESNREDFSCDGANVNSPLYMGSLWFKHKVKYFWNPYFEDFSIDFKHVFYSSLLIPYNGISTSLPQIRYASHPNYKGFFQWYTYNLTQAPEPFLWNYFFSDERLNDFIKQRGTFISHVYPASVHNNYGFWKITDIEEIVITPEFDAVLSKLSKLRNEKKINLCTIQSWMDDNLNKEKLQYIFNENGCFIQNKSDLEIKDIGLIYPDGSIKIVNFAPNHLLEVLK